MVVGWTLAEAIVTRGVGVPRPIGPGRTESGGCVEITRAFAEDVRARFGFCFAMMKSIEGDNVARFPIAEKRKYYVIRNISRKGRDVFR